MVKIEMKRKKKQTKIHYFSPSSLINISYQNKITKKKKKIENEKNIILSLNRLYCSVCWKIRLDKFFDGIIGRRKNKKYFTFIVVYLVFVSFARKIIYYFTPNDKWKKKTFKNKTFLCIMFFEKFSIIRITHSNKENKLFLFSHLNALSGLLNI